MSAWKTKLPMQQMQTVLRDSPWAVAQEGGLDPLKYGVLLVWGWEQQDMGSQRGAKAVSHNTYPEWPPPDSQALQ